MPEDEEEGFTFRDRRRSSVDAPPATPPAPAPSESTPLFKEEMPTAPTLSTVPTDDGYEREDQGYELETEGYDPEAEGDSTELPDVRSVLALFMGELRNLAWLRMGLVANPMTGQLEPDLDQAKIAIDTVTFLAQQLEPHVAPEERLPLKAMVSDLRLNFVEQSKRA